MDPLAIILITNALAAGASSAVEASKDTYQILKMLIRRRIGDEPEALLVLDKYEEKPGVWRGPLRDKLEQVHADQDEEIIKTAQNLIALTKPQQADAYKNVNTSRTIFESMYRQMTRETRLWSLLSLIAVVVGSLLLLGGIVAFLLGFTPLGVITITAGTIVELGASLFFWQTREANERLDNIRQKLIETDTLIGAMTLALSTNNEELKQEIISQLVERYQKNFSLYSDQQSIGNITKSSSSE